MIFVTVGNATQPFPRLLTRVDALAASGLFGSESVFVQAGTYRGPLGSCDAKPFVSRAEFRDWLKRASLVISHGGAGTILEAARLNQRPVVMPRLRRYREVVNDHQVQIVRALAAEGLLVPAWEPEELAAAIEAARRSPMRRSRLLPSRMLDLVAAALEELAPSTCRASGAAPTGHVRW